MYFMIEIELFFKSLFKLSVPIAEVVKTFDLLLSIVANSLLFMISFSDTKVSTSFFVYS